MWGGEGRGAGEGGGMGRVGWRLSTEVERPRLGPSLDNRALTAGGGCEGVRVWGCGGVGCVGVWGCGVCGCVGGWGVGVWGSGGNTTLKR